MGKFKNLGIIKNELIYDESQLNGFERNIGDLKSNPRWSKQMIVDEFFKMIPDFDYHDNGKYLDSKM